MNSNKDVVTRWWWVRHAPVTVNEGRCYGQDDLPCDVGNLAAFAGLAAAYHEPTTKGGNAITAPLLEVSTHHRAFPHRPRR